MSLKFIHHSAQKRHLVILVHGFTGGENTFTNSKRESLCGFLPKPILGACDFAAFNYGSSIIDFVPNWVYLLPGAKKILGRKNRCLKAYAKLLETYYEQFIGNYETVSFICHSMGGVVAKLAIISLIKRLKSFPGFYITLATPHRGVEAAVVGSPFHIHVDELRPHSSTIIESSDAWTSCVSSIKRCYFSATYDEVVTEFSACPPGEEQLHVRVEGGHVEICKPATADDILVAVLSRKISEFLGIYSLSQCIRDEQAGPLFLCYFPEMEKYYVPRDADTFLVAAIARRNTWVFGPSGCGKTNLVQRLSSRCGFSKVVYIDVTASDGGAQEALDAILDTLRLHLDQEAPDVEFVAATTAIQSIIRALGILAHEENLIFIIDEVNMTDGIELSKFISAVTQISRVQVKREGGGAVRMVICTSGDPYACLKPEAADLLNEHFESFRLKKWSSDELNKLYIIIREKLNIALSKTDEARVFDYSAGSPRRFKHIFRQASARSRSQAHLSVENAVAEVLNLESIL